MTTTEAVKSPALTRQEADTIRAALVALKAYSDRLSGAAIRGSNQKGYGRAAGSLDSALSSLNHALVVANVWAMDGEARFVLFPNERS